MTHATATAALAQKWTLWTCSKSLKAMLQAVRAHIKQLVEAQTGYVYLLHFERSLHPNSPNRHYTGWTVDLDRRIAQHRSGRGARFCKVAAERGIAFQVAEIWTGTRQLERAIKRQHNAPRYCPVCNRRMSA